jgi:transposase InsO family protein
LSGCGEPILWGSPKIVAELAMLGIDVAKSTVEKYKPKRTGPPSPTWRTFLDQHVRDLVSIDFFIVPTVKFRILFVFIVLAHDRRRIVHFNVTEHPTAQWTAQQIIEAFPFDTAPGYLIRDGDGVYSERVTRRIGSMGIDEVVTAPASPWQNAYVERVIGTLRRELFDHVIVLNERHLKRLMSLYLDYTTILGEHIKPWMVTRLTGVPYDQRNPAMLLNSQSSKAFTMSIFRRLHEYSGRPGTWQLILHGAAVSKSSKQEIDRIHDLVSLNLKRQYFLAKNAFRNPGDLFGDHDHLYAFNLKLRVEVLGGLPAFG